MDMLLAMVIKVIAHPFALITLFSGSINEQVGRIYFSQYVLYFKVSVAFPLFQVLEKHRQPFFFLIYIK